MSIEQKHLAIRQALAAIGYYVRDEKGKPLQIVLKHRIEQALYPNIRVRMHDDFLLYIESVAA